MASDISETNSTATKTRAFISYSRRDRAFVDRLGEALEARGIHALIDRTEIYAFDEWWKRIENLIVSADTVIFVLSPDAVASDVCKKEVAFAAALNKRFAPIIHRAVEASAVPPELAQLNYVFFDDENLFDKSADRLAEALLTDINWIRKHTEFGEAARRWSLAGRPGPRGLLLRSPLLDEAESWIASRPHNAPPPTEATRAFIVESRRAAVRRRRALTASVSAVLLAAVLVGAYVFMQRRINRLNVAAYRTEEAQSLLAAQSPEQAALVAEQALPHNPETSWSWSYVVERILGRDTSSATLATLAEAQREYPLKAVLVGHKQAVTIVAVSASGNVVATAAPDGEVRFWNVNASLAERPPLDEKGVTAATFAPNDLDLAFGFFDGAVRIVNIRSGDRKPLPAALTSPVIALGFSRDGNTCVAVANDGTVAIWDLKGQPALVRTIPSPEKGQSVGAAAVDVEDGRVAMSWTGGGALIIDLASGAPRIQFSDSARQEFNFLKFSPDGKRLAVATAYTAWVRDAISGDVLSVLPQKDQSISSIALSDADIAVAVGREIELFDASTGRWVKRLEGQVGSPSPVQDKSRETEPFSVVSMAFTPDGHWLVTGSKERTARIWNVDPTSQVVANAPRSVLEVVFSPSGDQIGMVAGDAADLMPYVYDRTTRTVAQVAADMPAWLIPHYDLRHPSGALGERWQWLTSPTGKQRAYRGDQTGVARLVSQDGHVILLNHKHDNTQVTALTYSPDGLRVVTGSTIGVAWVWDAQTGQPIFSLQKSAAEPTAHSDLISSIAYSPDGDTIATASWDGTVRLWDARTGALRRTLQGHTNRVAAVIFSPDSSRVVSASWDHTARLWNSRTGTLLYVFLGHQDKVTSLALSPDGRDLATASADRTVRLWPNVWSLDENETVWYAHIAAVRRLTDDERKILLGEDNPRRCQTQSQTAIDETDAATQMDRAAHDEASSLDNALCHYAIATRLYEQRCDENRAFVARYHRATLARIVPAKRAAAIARKLGRGQSCADDAQ